MNLKLIKRVIVAAVIILFASVCFYGYNNYLLHRVIIITEEGSSTSDPSKGNNIYIVLTEGYNNDLLERVNMNKMNIILTTKASTGTAYDTVISRQISNTVSLVINDDTIYVPNVNKHVQINVKK